MGHVITIAQQKGGAGKTTLAVSLAGEFLQRGQRVALLDTDPQGSLGRWFMARRDRGGEGLDFSTASAWGVSYECEKLRKINDLVIVDTPPKVDADLRPALREADLVLIPVASSLVDLWAIDGVLDLITRESRPALVVLNRWKSGTRLAEEVAQAAEGKAEIAASRLGSRIVYAESLGQGRAVSDGPRTAARAEVAALADEVAARLQR